MVAVEKDTLFARMCVQINGPPKQFFKIQKDNKVLNGIDLGLLLRTWVLIMAIQILSKAAGSIMSSGNAFRVDHRDEVEGELIEQQFVLLGY